MATRTTRDFRISFPDSDPVTLTGKAKVVVDGMGTRIYNHDGSVAFSSPSTSITVLEISSSEETIPDPVVPDDGEPA